MCQLPFHPTLLNARKISHSPTFEQVDFLNDQCATMESELHAKRLAHEKVGKQQAQIESLQAELAEAKSAREEARGELEYALAAVTELKARGFGKSAHAHFPSSGGKAKSEAERADKAEAEVESLKAAMNALTKESADAVQTARERMAVAEGERAAAKEVYAAYQADTKRLGGQVQQLQEDVKSLESDLMQAQNYGATCERREEAARGEATRVSSALKDAQAEVYRLEGELARLHGERDALKRAAGGLRAELEAARQGAVELRSSRAAVDEKEAAERREKESLQLQLAALEATRAEMKEEISAYHGQAEQLQSLLGSQQAEREGLEREVDRLTQLLHGERSSTAALRTEISTLQHRLQEQHESGKSLHQVRERLIPALPGMPAVMRVNATIPALMRSSRSLADSLSPPPTPPEPWVVMRCFRHALLM